MAKSSAESNKTSTEDDLLELAKKELLRDIKCASMRAEQFGAHSWAKPQKYIPSKRFLKSMIMHSSSYNDRKNMQLNKAKMLSREQMATSLYKSTSQEKSRSVSESRSERERSKHKRSRWEDGSSDTKSGSYKDESLKKHKHKRSK